MKGIANIEGVNRLHPQASLTFCPEALTIVFGRNGSGKSGFVRILRTACRTRIESAAKLKVLADVYGDGEGPQSADIIIDAGSGDTAVAWTPDMPASAQLMQVAVFDSTSAQLYVDGGNQIRYLPFGLALPHRLNTVCLVLKEHLDAERAVAVGDKLALTAIAFPSIRATAAQLFDTALSAGTDDAAIYTATGFNTNDQLRLDDISGVLSAGAAASADLAALVTWIDAVTIECTASIQAVGDAALAAASSLKADATTKRGAAELSADVLFTDEPLSGVGSATWRALWNAARDYSVGEAYVDRPFPVVALDSGDAACVLCQQPLLADGAARMERFRTHMAEALDTSATLAEAALTDAIAAVPNFKYFGVAEFPGRIDQIRQRDPGLADALSLFGTQVIGRRTDLLDRLAGGLGKTFIPLASPAAATQAISIKLASEKAALENASDAAARETLIAEKAELEDYKTLTASRTTLVTRRDLMATDAKFIKALAELHTKGITQRANDLLDTHLTAAVVERFDLERKRFEITHLKVSLSRKSDKTKAEYGVDPQTKLAKLTSDILSEGEQRALALAGFLTEVALTEGSGPIVVDDPVSSLDRDRSALVADRLAEEARERQVVVFTHDMVFFNELCRAADARDIQPVTVALFGDGQAAGKTDPAGLSWKGLSVDKRIKMIRAHFVPIEKLQPTSPTDYEVGVKNLYGRLRDIYERVVEEVIFRDIVRRGSDVIQTQLLRYVTLSDALAFRFHDGMTRANTHSHDNPASDTVKVPTPNEFKLDLGAVEQLVVDLRAESAAAEAKRPQMRLKK